MSLELPPPIHLGEVDPALFDYATEKYKRVPNKTTSLSEPVLGETAEYIAPLLAKLAELGIKQGNPKNRVIHFMRSNAEPGTQFINVRSWHRDLVNEILVADTQPTHYLSGHMRFSLQDSARIFALDGDRRLQQFEDHVSQYSDTELQDKGLTIEQAAPYVATLCTVNSFHRSPLNQTDHTVERYFIAISLH